jgi:hypothetical protein
MSTLTLRARQDGQIEYTKDSDAPVVIETNVGLLNISLMRVRLLCDFIKDALVDSKLNMNQCKQIIRNIYCKGNITDPSPMTTADIEYLFNSDYKVLLQELEDRLDKAPNIKAQTTELINQPKLSTVGSNTKISDAEHVFYESGFGSESIMRSKGYQNILTPAAIMDPLHKEVANVYFPMPNLNIVFDKSFTNRLGFPDTMWGCNDIQVPSHQVPIAKQVSIQYTQLINGLTPEILSVGFIPINDFIPFTTKSDIKKGPFGPYLKGNKEKNADILKLTESGFSADETGKIIGIADNTAIMQIIKILETKELGDVAQIWLYLAYLIENNLLAQREKALMITTDSVVYLFCQLLNLSCAYTGSRAKVESKNCSIYHYVAGPPDYQQKISNMLTNAWDIVAQKIASQKFIVASVIAADAAMDFWYMGYRKGKLSEVPGLTDWNTRRGLDSNRIQFILQRFNEFIIDLDNKAEGLVKIQQDISTYLTENLHGDDLQVMKTFALYHTQILQFQCEPYFTIVKADKEVYQKGSKKFLQDKFVAEFYPKLQGGGSSIDKVNYMTNETSSSKFISEEKNYVGGIMNRSDINDEIGIGLLEATILIYSYYNLTLQGAIEKSIEEDFDENEISVFAISYDKHAYNINDTEYQKFYTFMIGKQLAVYDFPSTTIKVMITLDEESIEENILVFGTVLSQYLYFEKDLRVIDPQLNYLIKAAEAAVAARARRSVPVPIFEPDTLCEGNYDVFTRNRIRGTGMQIYGKCYSGHSIIRRLIDIAPVLDSISRPEEILFNRLIRLFLTLFRELYNISYTGELLDYLRSNIAYQVEFIRHLRNIFAFMFTYYPRYYLELQTLIPDGPDGQKALNFYGFTEHISLVLKVENTFIKFDTTTLQGEKQLFFGGSNKYLLKKIKSKKNRVKKVKSKKNRAKKIKSKQHRLKKIKSKKFTRKNKKSKNGVI